MKYSAYILIIAAAVLTAVGCGQSEDQANAEMNTAKPTKQSVEAIPAADTDTQAKPVVSTDSLDEHNWYHDWDEGLAAAKRENKPIIVDFYTDWCHWCTVMDEETFSAPAVMKAMNDDWVKIKINAEDNNTKGTFRDKTLPYSNLAQAFGVRGYPSYLFFDKEGQPITVISSYFEKEKFLPILEYFEKELYAEEVNLQEYIESNS